MESEQDYYFFNKYIAERVNVEKFEDGEAIFSIPVTEELSNKSGVIDEGMVISIIDLFSSFSHYALNKDKFDINRASVSMNIKVYSFDNMYLGLTYKMVVLIKHSLKKSVLYEVQIFDNENKLVKIGLHLTRIVKAKF